MKTFKKIAVLGLLSLSLAACNGPAANGENPDDKTGNCGKCPTGTECHNGKCESLCTTDANCGKCSKCVDNFCNKYADFCVVSVEPASGKTGVPIETQTMKVTFSDDVNANSINKDSIGLTKGTGDTITSTASVSGPTVTLSIGTLLSPASSYTIWVETAVQSSSLVFIPERFESSFTTITSETSATGPAGFGLSPVAGHMEGGRYTLDVVGGPVAGTAEGGRASVTVSDGFWK